MLDEVLFLIAMMLWDLITDRDDGRVIQLGLGKESPCPVRAAKNQG